MAGSNTRTYSVFRQERPDNGPAPLPLPPAGFEKVFKGTAGNNTFHGTAGADTFNMGKGGNDTVFGKGGNDVFNFGASLTKLDSIDGGPGNDRVNLGGDYSGAHAVVFNATTMKNVETLHLDNHSYTLTLNNATVAANKTLTVDARAMDSTRTFNFNAAAEHDGRLNILVGAGKAVITGGGQADSFHLGAHLDANDRIDGGGGDDNVVFLDGDYSDGLTFGPNTIRNIHSIELAAGHDYFFTLDNATVKFGDLLLVDGADLGAGDSLTLDGSAETSSELELTGGAGNDQLVGGNGGDLLAPGGGEDFVSGGPGNDTIFYNNSFFDSGDFIDGGDGYDTLELFGDYSISDLRHQHRHQCGARALRGGLQLQSCHPEWGYPRRPYADGRRPHPEFPKHFDLECGDRRRAPRGHRWIRQRHPDARPQRFRRDRRRRGKRHRQCRRQSCRNRPRRRRIRRRYADPGRRLYGPPGVRFAHGAQCRDHPACRRPQLRFCHGGRDRGGLAGADHRRFGPVRPQHRELRRLSPNTTAISPFSAASAATAS